jgi:hypothetical protein
MAASTGTAGSDGQKKNEIDESLSDLRDESIEHEHHKTKIKNIFFLTELKQDPYNYGDHCSPSLIYY